MRHRHRRHGAHRGRASRWWPRPLAGALVAALVTWLAVCVDVLDSPDVDPYGPVDAVYVTGPVETRIEQALALMDDGLAPVLLTTPSVREDGTTYATGHCGAVAATYRVGCVLPDPSSTRGEAQALAEQVAAHGWTRVAVLTSRAHAARTRLLVERCVDADTEVLVWTDDDGPAAAGAARLHGFVRQSAAWVEAQLVRGC